MYTNIPIEWINTDPTDAVNRIISDACHLGGYPIFHHLRLPTEAFAYDRSIEEIEALCDALLSEATDLMLARRALEDAVLDEWDALYAGGLIDALQILEQSADDVCARLMSRLQFDKSLYALIDNNGGQAAA